MNNIGIIVVVVILLLIIIIVLAVVYRNRHSSPDDGQCVKENSLLWNEYNTAIEQYHQAKANGQCTSCARTSLDEYLVNILRDSNTGGGASPHQPEQKLFDLAREYNDKMVVVIDKLVAGDIANIQYDVESWRDTAREIDQLRARGPVFQNHVKQVLASLPAGRNYVTSAGVISLPA